MKVTLFDRTEIIIGSEQGKRLEAALGKGSDGFVRLNGMMIKKSAIAYLRPGGTTEADLAKPNDPARRLKRDNRTDEQQYQAARLAADVVREKFPKLKVTKHA